MKNRKRKAMQPQWKVTVLWVYASLLFVSLWWMTCLYATPSELSFHYNRTRTNYTCTIYRDRTYCCEDTPWGVITDKNLSDNITDDNITISDCYRLEKKRHDFRQFFPLCEGKISPLN